jgi:hypothetical protein
VRSENSPCRPVIQLSHNNMGRHLWLYVLGAACLWSAQTVIIHVAGTVSPSPTSLPSGTPTGKPTSHPSSPSSRPTSEPSTQPSAVPTRQPSSKPSGHPTSIPSMAPSRQPTSQPTRQPTRRPSSKPSVQPSSQPTQQPSIQPSMQPTIQPSSQPTRQPTERPSSQPSAVPSNQPTSQPTVRPTTSVPSSRPSSAPTKYPTTPSPTIDGDTNPPTSVPTLVPTIQTANYVNNSVYQSFLENVDRFTSVSNTISFATMSYKDLNLYGSCPNWQYFSAGSLNLPSSQYYFASVNATFHYENVQTNSFFSEDVACTDADFVGRLVDSVKSGSQFLGRCGENEWRAYWCNNVAVICVDCKFTCGADACPGRLNKIISPCLTCSSPDYAYYSMIRFAVSTKSLFPQFVAQSYRGSASTGIRVVASSRTSVSLQFAFDKAGWGSAMPPSTR